MTVVALAQDADRPVVSKKKPPTTGTTVNLINLLVQKGVLKEEQAAELIKQSEDEAYVAREAARDATAKADEAAKTAGAAAAAASPPGSKRVTYVPEIVKRQLREDLRKEVMTQAKNEGWASPGKYPEWASRIRFYGDFRGRWENIMYPGGGYNSIGQVIDFNAINTARLTTFLTIAIRTDIRWSTRHRVVNAPAYARGWAWRRICSMASRRACGSPPARTTRRSRPIRRWAVLAGTSRSMGCGLIAPYIKYEPFRSPWGSGLGEPSAVAFTAGRFDNPFWSPTELVWDSDLGFDGIAVQARHEIMPGFTPFVVAGAFPIFNTSLDFSTIEPVKFKSEDKYLFGGQLGFVWKSRATGWFHFRRCDLRLQQREGQAVEPLRPFERERLRHRLAAAVLCAKGKYLYLSARHHPECAQ